MVRSLYNVCRLLKSSDLGMKNLELNKFDNYISYMRLIIILWPMHMQRMAYNSN